MKQLLRNLVSKLHILVISLLLTSFTLGTAGMSTSVSSGKSAPRKQQDITRLSTGPSVASQNQNSNAYEPGPADASWGSVEAQNESQPSISTPQNDDWVPPSPVSTPPVTCSPCSSSPGCVSDCPAPPPEPGPISGCGGCGTAPLPNRQAMQMCPMCAYTAN